MLQKKPSFKKFHLKSQITYESWGINMMTYNFYSHVNKKFLLYFNSNTAQEKQLSSVRKF